MTVRIWRSFLVQSSEMASSHAVFQGTLARYYLELAVKSWPRGSCWLGLPLEHREHLWRVAEYFSPGEASLVLSPYSPFLLEQSQGFYWPPMVVMMSWDWDASHLVGWMHWVTEHASEERLPHIRDSWQWHMNNPSTLVLISGLSHTPVSPASDITSAPWPWSPAAEAGCHLSCDGPSWSLPGV